MKIRQQQPAGALMLKAVAVVAASLVTSSAMATMIVYETRYTDKSVNQSDYRASWNEQTSAVASNDLAAFTGIAATGANQHSRLTVEFDVHEANAGDDWAFRIAADAGFGGAMYLNDQLLDIDTSDLWWGTNWGNSDELLSAFDITVDAGAQTLEVYWAEGCCNGGQSGQFSIDGGDNWQALSIENLEHVSVPEPGMLALMATGLFGFGLARRKRTA